MERSTFPLLLRYPASVPDRFCGGVVALGNFDGVHLGHRHVLGAVQQLASGRPVSVVSFYPHPVRVLRGDNEPRALSTLREKREQFGGLGVDLVYGIHFTKSFSHVTAQEFIERVIVGALRAKLLVVGEDVAIGHRREGNLEYLRRELPKYGVALHVVPTLKLDGERPSSRRIRQLLLDGDVRRAREMIGAPFAVSARVGHGDKRGQQIGFPTANVMTGGRLLPKRGVYACKVEISGETFDGVANIGVRPTFNGTGERLEVHILKQALGSLYGKRLRVNFVERLRDELKFDSISQLRDRIARDVKDAERALRHGG